MKIISIVGARPQFIKLAPLVRSLKENNKSTNRIEIEHSICHTGQHYDYEMNKVFFDELGIPAPAYNLDVGSGSHGWQTGEMLRRAEDVLMKEQPDWVLVYGDTNSTLAGAMAAAKLHISVAHIEAGLRSYNKKMPEEINRVLADRCSDILFCPTENAVQNLKKEGFTNAINNGKLLDRSFFDNDTSPGPFDRFPIVLNVGDIMYDVLLMNLELAEKKSAILDKLKLKPKEYYLATIHRAENTDGENTLRNIVEAFVEISRTKPVVFPIHPRTKKVMSSFHLDKNIGDSLHLVDPVNYSDMILLEKNAKGILTDSGGIQKEAFWLKVPCFTLRSETEWSETLESKSNLLVGSEKDEIVDKVKNSETYFRFKSNPVFGNGSASILLVHTFMIFQSS